MNCQPLPPSGDNYKESVVTLGACGRWRDGKNV